MDDSNKNKLTKLENLNKFKEFIIEKIISPITTNITNLQKSLENKAEKTHNHDDSYLKLSGGNVSGDITLNNTIKISSKDKGGTTRGLIWMNDATNGEVVIGGGTNQVTFDIPSPNSLKIWCDGTQKSYEVYHSGNFTPDNYLPLSGGLITDNVDFANGKGIHGKDSKGTNQRMIVVGADDCCYLGGVYLHTYIRSKDCPQYLDANGNKYDIYHAGNFSKDMVVLFEKNNGKINKNINTCFDSSSGDFTAPEAGQYLVMCGGYELSSSSSEYVACVLDSSSSNQNKLYTASSSGFTLITLNKGQTLAIYTATAGNMNKTCISTNTIVNMLIAKIN